ncbi:LacI family DNA-binding transcriptional regulator [Naumannella cuiyingiana]|uniref:DNA-binding LacI/PurR family transcriptional regulator n=1 Tax=Naumannella cuiyingiana TaxID=1347891 RepID=A0A7Z0IJW4_9ACTN|nr:LacI family DNA-binding transcriptional regulator [Naumannella cuiyingiana]NYI69979.1 DNA-binding LacI/PurR family transcriptional regulator [Naumannella cuiyingiana]
MTNRVTLRTIAEAVGVSAATVSNAYNKPDQLSAELRDRILAKAEDLGYAGPDASARSLRRGRSGSVGLVTHQQLSYAFSDPYAIALIRSLTRVLEQHGTSLLLLPVNDDDPDGIEAARRAQVDGMAALCLTTRGDLIELARRRGVRLIGTDVSPQGCWVAVDDRAVGRQLGEHLAALGHREIVVLCDELESGREQPRGLGQDWRGTYLAPRITGLESALPDARIRVFTGGHNTREAGRLAAAHVLDSRNRPTAIVGLSDVLALGALDALAVRGLDAPGDISVAGFDDVPEAAAAGLTTVRQPIEEKGRLVGELLIGEAEPTEQITLPTELVVRRTTGPVPTTD